MKKACVLFSGGKDSAYAAYLAKKAGYELTCLITIFSRNKFSYMFHTPSVSETERQAEVMDIPLVTKETKGIEEKELDDLEEVIKEVKEKYQIRAVITGALHSEYQASRIQKICDNLKLKCFNPLWQKEEIPYLHELIDANFKIIVTGVFAYPLDKSWLGRIIDNEFIKEVEKLKDKYKIHAAGEGGEFETFVLNCPLFKRELKVIAFKDTDEGANSWRREIEVE